MIFDQHQTVEVTVSPTEVSPGDTVEATVVVHGEEDSKVKSAVVRLVRTEHVRLSQAGVVVDTSVEDTNDRVIAEVAIEFGAGTHRATLTIPKDALPSARHGVDWTVQAQIIRHHGRDVKAEAVLEVLAPYDPDLAASPAPPKVRRGRDFIDIDVDNRVVRPGDQVTGTVYLRPNEAVTITELDVGLNLMDGSDMDQHSFEVQTATAPVRSSLSLSPGEVKQYPFKLTVPTDAAPSVDASRRTPPGPVLVRWSVRALTFLLHSMADNDVSIELYVYNGPTPGHS
jgi:hypothetical protein